MQAYSKSQLRFHKKKRRIEELAKTYNFDFLNVHDEQHGEFQQLSDEKQDLDVNSSDFDYNSNCTSITQNINESLDNNSPSIEPDDNSDFNNEEINEKNVYASLISLFFRGNLTQSTFKLVIEHTQLLIPFKLPKDFDQLMGKIEKERLMYTKQWFCQKCCKYISLSHNKQRNCLICYSK